MLPYNEDVNIHVPEQCMVGYILDEEIWSTMQSDKISGVYEILSTETKWTLQYFMRMTNRKLKTRREEHAADIKYNKKTISVATLHTVETLQINFKIIK